MKAVEAKINNYIVDVYLIESLDDLKELFRHSYSKYDHLDDEFAEIMMKELSENYVYVLVDWEEANGVNYPVIQECHKENIL